MMAKEWIVIDSRTHFTPKKVAGSASQADGTDHQAISNKRAAGLEKTHDIEYRLPLMDEAGVDLKGFLDTAQQHTDNRRMGVAQSPNNPGGVQRS